MSRFARLALAVVAAVALAGCAEREQTTADSRVKKSDAKAWDVAQSPYVAPGWKAGDQGSWEAQMRTRAQTQNEYLRTPAKPQ